MLFVVLVSVSSLVCSLLFTPLVRKFAIKLDAIAASNHRTIHKHETPKLGGLAIFGAFAIGNLVLFAMAPEGLPVTGLLLGGAVCVVLGFFDDLYVLNCYRKLIFQTLAAAIAVHFGFKIEVASLTGSSGIELGMFSYPLSVLWIVAIMNAVNLLDGLDSLATGFTIVLTLLFLVVATLTQNIALALMAAMLLASALGFMRYNFPPAKIFMGDTGSLFLGFALACLSIKAFTSNTTGTNMAALVLPFAMPLADTLLATVRRLSEGKHPFWADRKHIHHRLLDSGLSQLQAAMLMNGLTVIFAAAGFFVLFLNGLQALYLLTAVGILFTLWLYRLGCFDFLFKKEDVAPEVRRIVVTRASAPQPVSEHT